MVPGFPRGRRSQMTRCPSTRSDRWPTCWASRPRSCAASTPSTSSALRIQPAVNVGIRGLEIEGIHAVTELIGEGFTLPAVQRILALQAEVEDLRRQLALRRSDAWESTRR